MVGQDGSGTKPPLGTVHLIIRKLRPPVATEKYSSKVLKAIVNPSPHLEGHTGLEMEQALGTFRVAFYSGSGLGHVFKHKGFGGWLFFGTAVRDRRDGLLFRHQNGPSKRGEGVEAIRIHQK